MLFAGTIPTQIGQLDKVIDLDMSRNSLGGKLHTTHYSLNPIHYSLNTTLLMVAI